MKVKNNFRVVDISMMVIAIILILAFSVLAIQVSNELTERGFKGILMEFWEGENAR